MNTSVVVLAGGWSRERDVSLMGSECIASALRGAGYDVRVIDVQRDMSSLIRALRPQPDVVYNALHGPYGEDGCIQGMLECLDPLYPFRRFGVCAGYGQTDGQTPIPNRRYPLP